MTGVILVIATSYTITRSIIALHIKGTANPFYG
jgi:hypothetical protein